MDSRYAGPTEKNFQDQAEPERVQTEISADDGLIAASGSDSPPPPPPPPDYEQRNQKREGDELESTKRVTFYPPVGIQRYLKVRQVLEDLINSKDDVEPKSILEVGCASFNLHVYLKNMQTVEKLLYLDIDRTTMLDAVRKLQPLCAEFLVKRPRPLAVEAYVGDVTDLDGLLLRTQPPLFGIVAIEVVEHLVPEVLLGFERTVFGLLEPPVVLVTTPNSEFNVVFELKPGQFRHWDHKFEWTRLEFEAWCQSICKTYPCYSFQVCGIGEGGPGTEQFGSVSQMATFIKTADSLYSPTNQLPTDCLKENVYKLLYRVDYPFFVDTRTRSEKILSHFDYYVNTFILSSANVYEFIAEGISEYKLSLSRISEFYGMPEGTTKEEILDTLRGAEKDVRLDEEEDDYVVLLPVTEPECSDSDLDEDDGPVGQEDEARTESGHKTGPDSNLVLWESEEEW